MKKQEFKITIEVIDGEIKSSINSNGFNTLELIGLGTVIDQVYEEFINTELKEQ